VQGSHACGKLHSLTQMAHPVLRGGDFVARQLPSHIGDQAQHGWVVEHAAGDSGKLRQDRLHQRRVKCMGDLQCLPLHPFCRQALHHLLDSRTSAGNHHTLWAVDCGYRHFSTRSLSVDEWNLALSHDIDCCNRFSGPHLAHRQRHHLSLLRQRPHQPSTCSHQSQPILQAEDSCHTGRRQLPHTVAEQQVWLDPPCHPQCRQGIFQRKKGRLGARSLVYRRRVLEHLEQRAFALSLQQLRTTVDRAAKKRFRRIEFLTHACRLRTLSAEEHGQTRGIVSRSALHDPARLLCARQGCQLTFQCFLVRRHQGDSLGKVVAPHRSRVAERVQVRFRLQRCQVACGQRRQCCGITRREREQKGRARPVYRGRGGSC